MATIPGTQICIPISGAQVVIWEMERLLRDRRKYKVGRRKFLRVWSALRVRLFLTPEYKAWRRAVLATTGGKCDECDATAVHCHHVVQVSFCPGMALDPNNGRPKCRKHHKRIHRRT
jgi:hypothetical protein